MSAQMTEITRVTKPSNRRPARTRTVSTRVTEAEYVALQEQAWSTGKTVCDWARECIAQPLEKGSGKNLETHLFTELVGIQLLLMNTLGPILRGERMAAEEVDVVFRQVQTRKAGKAREILNKRLSRELESRGVTQPQTARTAISLDLDSHLINAYPGNIRYKLQVITDNSAAIVFQALPRTARHTENPISRGERETFRQLAETKNGPRRDDVI